jgi:hypothetical protein
MVVELVCVLLTLLWPRRLFFERTDRSLSFLTTELAAFFWSLDIVLKKFTIFPSSMLQMDDLLLVKDYCEGFPKLISFKLIVL